MEHLKMYSVLLLVLATIPGISCRIYQKQLSYSTQFQSLMSRSFGFLNNSEVHFSMSCSLVNSVQLPVFYLLFCSSSGAKEFSRMAQSQVRNDCLRISTG